MSEPSCQSHDPEKWFPLAAKGKMAGASRATAAAAGRICRDCPLRKQCAVKAQEMKVTNGIWAGVWIDDPQSKPRLAYQQLAVIADASPLPAIEQVEQADLPGGLRPCAWCQWPMRPYNALIADYPGTVTRSSHGLCTSCYTRESRGYRGASDVHSDARRDLAHELRGRGRTVAAIAVEMGVHQRTVERYLAAVPS